jgi:biopolymer transport protein ExbB/TolQ
MISFDPFLELLICFYILMFSWLFFLILHGSSLNVSLLLWRGGRKENLFEKKKKINESVPKAFWL